MVGLIFSTVLHPAGLFNEFLRAVGLGGLARSWLTEQSLVMYSVSFVEIWMYAGFHMAIYLAGLQSIPQELLEAATIDGATRGRPASPQLFGWGPSCPISTIRREICGACWLTVSRPASAASFASAAA